MDIPGVSTLYKYNTQKISRLINATKSSQAMNRASVKLKKTTFRSSLSVSVADIRPNVCFNSTLTRLVAREDLIENIFEAQNLL
jgi:hypothetical protein